MRLGLPILLLFAPLFGQVPSAAVERARAQYQQTDYDGSLKTLLGLKDQRAAALALTGRNYFMKADYKRASEFFEKAAAMEPNSSEHALWLGRSYGRRAESSSLFTAPGLAIKARTQFERAVALDPGSKEALNDLFEYYVEAPSFMGGGHEKARALLDKIGSLDPAERYFAEAKLAESRKEYKTTEVQLRRAMEVAPRQIGRAIDLARFLARQGRVKESDAVFAQAEQIDPNHPKLLYDRAETWVESKRNLEQARQLLGRYLSSTSLTPDTPSREEARRLLRKAGGE